MELSPEEARVAGALAEKQLTTPQQYPLTLNALVAACNQASNRNPVVSYDELTVQATLDSLKSRGLLRFVHASHGRSATRYRQVLEEAFGLDTRQLAVLTVLLLRGPQTPGELRARTDRMTEFASVDDVEATLEALAARPDPLVRRLTRQPGQKEARYVHLLGATAEDAIVDAPPALTPLPATAPRQAPLAEEVARLRYEVETLRRDVDELMSRLEGL